MGKKRGRSAEAMRALRKKFGLGEFADRPNKTRKTVRKTTRQAESSTDLLDLGV